MDCATPNAVTETRRYWVTLAERLSRPLLEALVSRNFRQQFPVGGRAGASRAQHAATESLSRLLNGIAPWLECPIMNNEEAAARDEILAMARQALHQISAPDCPESGEWSASLNAVVDAGILSHALLRAPKALWFGLSEETRTNLLHCLRQTRRHKPWFNNWLLFSGILETFLHVAGEESDPMRIDYAVRQHEQWYAGDGHYSDGTAFHSDYYNSFVIHPMLVDVVRLAPSSADVSRLLETVRARLSRYAAILERQISPEGTFPPVGRSLAYRFGAFHALSQAVVMDLLPPDVQPAQVRCALTAVIRRLADAPGTFDENGFLTVGFAGHQPALGEIYITNASAYLCSSVLLPLGLSSQHPFWSTPDAPWTSVRIWNGEDLPCDHAISI